MSRDLRVLLAVAVLGTLILVANFSSLSHSSEPAAHTQVEDVAQPGVSPCDDLPSILVVSAHWAEDLTWLHTQVPYPVLVYQKLRSSTDYATNPVYPNHGQEATAYLKYILDNYDSGFPDVVLFIHGHEAAWHVCELDGTMSKLIQSFRFTKYPYANIKYTNYYTLPENWYNKPELRAGNRAQFYIAEYWDLFKSHPSDKIPAPYASHCCAQFAVSRSRIYSRSKEYYQKIYDFLMSGKLEDFWSSRMMELGWSLVFSEPGITPYRRACELYTCKPEDENSGEVDPEDALESELSKKYRNLQCKNWVRVKTKGHPDWIEPEYKGLDTTKWSVIKELGDLETSEAKPRVKNATVVAANGKVELKKPSAELKKPAVKKKSKQLPAESGSINKKKEVNNGKT